MGEAIGVISITVTAIARTIVPHDSNAVGRRLGVMHRSQIAQKKPERANWCRVGAKIQLLCGECQAANRRRGSVLRGVLAVLFMAKTCFPYHPGP
jgi:hypothetical protein